MPTLLKVKNYGSYFSIDEISQIDLLEFDYLEGETFYAVQLMNKDHTSMIVYISSSKYRALEELEKLVKKVTEKQPKR